MTLMPAIIENLSPHIQRKYSLVGLGGREKEGRDKEFTAIDEMAKNKCAVLRSFHRALKIYMQHCIFLLYWIIIYDLRDP